MLHTMLVTMVIATGDDFSLLIVLSTKRLFKHAAIFNALDPQSRIFIIITIRHITLIIVNSSVSR